MKFQWLNIQWKNVYVKEKLDWSVKPEQAMCLFCEV